MSGIPQWRRWLPLPAAAWVGLCLVALAWSQPGAAHHTADHGPTGPLAEVRFDQRLGAQVPPDLRFRDETGVWLRLGDLFGRKPLILTLNYFDCPMLCPLALEGLVRSLRALSFSVGQQFDVLTISFNPQETPESAAAMQAKSRQDYGRQGAEAGWHFLTGPEESIQRLSETVGFKAVYDAQRQEYAHAAGVMILTPQGRVARYLFALEVPVRDLRLALVEAADGAIGSPVDRLLLFCYRYDPATGQYTMLVRRALRLAGLATLLVFGVVLVVMFRRERHRPPPALPGSGSD
jgi:protein SCO1/2